VDTRIRPVTTRKCTPSGTEFNGSGRFGKRAPRVTLSDITAWIAFVALTVAIIYAVCILTWIVS
jgi:hypothetical protein